MISGNNAFNIVYIVIMGALINPLYNEFITYLEGQEKEKCVLWVLAQLEKKTLDIVQLYNEIISPAQYSGFCRSEQKEISIWEEHVRTAIIRTIIECCYPFIFKEREELYGASYQGKVVILCPPGELHEIGARMAADFFSLCGFQVLFVGANTPLDDILNVIKYSQPKYVGISVTNQYNLIEARDGIVKILELKKDVPFFKLILGGQACRRNYEACLKLGADLILDTFNDIRNLNEGKF
jgi:MerR family transcriptional regulator, light-induced transcriptional regulator